MKKQLKLAILVFTLAMSVVLCLSCGLTLPRPGGGSSGGKDSTGSDGSYSLRYSDDYSGDTSDGEQSGHKHIWQKIVGKNYIAKKADCKHIGEYFYSCSCGELSEKTFAFGDYGSHVIVTEDSKDATCVESGYIGKQYCKVCGTVFREKTELLPLGHNYVGGTCTRCGAKDAQHEHTPVITEEKRATCTENGYRVYKCADCGDFIEKIFLLATGHNYVSSVEQELSCTEDGIIRYTCDNCSDTYTVETHGEHSYYVSDRRSATCTENGYVEYTCGNCGEAYRDVIPAGKHNYTFAVVKNPTTREEGIRRYTCSKCGNSYDESIPKKAEVTGDRVLLVQDVLPWTERANNTVLTELVETGVISGYDVATTTALDEYDFYDYCVVIIANDQPSSSYSRLAGYKSALNAYVENGGVVVYGACDQGWENGDVSSALICSIGKGGNYYSNYNYIVNNTHPIITGELSDGVALTDELLYSTYASHTWFENLPDGSTVILQDGNGKPTLVEFTYGTGSVIATGLTWEYTYVRNFVKGTSFAKSVFDDMIIYAVSLSGEKCEHKYVSEVVPSTCVDKGYTLYTCTICGRKRKANFTPATGHAAVETVIKEATCTSEGLARITCEKCDYSEEKVLSKLSHVYELKASKEPTCTENGYNEYVCEVCGAVTGRYTVFATGHSYSSEVIQLLSCETDGIIRYTCNTCGDNYDVVTKGEHSYRVTARVAATCTSEGYVEYTCSKCDSSYREIIPVGAHSYTYKIVKRPTEVTTGIRRYTCTLCGDAYDEIIPVKVTGDSVLLVQDILPWTTSSNTSLLSSLVDDGTIAGYDVVTSAMLGDVAFEDYCVVIIANDQPSSTYSALASYAAKLTSYAENGGVVVYGACDQGWVNGDVSSALIGGIEKGGNYYSNYNYIVDSEHPIVTGSLTDGNGLTNELLYGTYASHTWFENLPEGSNIILQDGHGNPTLIEFSLGSGTVIATGLTWEFYYIRNMVGSTSFSRNVFDDMIIYAVSLTGDACMHHYVLKGSYSASCNKNGYKVYTCELCGKERKTDFIPAIGHILCGKPFDDNKTYVYEGEIASVVMLFGNATPTCTEQAYGCFTCERCEKIILIHVIAPHEIIYSEGKAATCTESGYAAYEYCTNCDYTTYEEIPALGHNFVNGTCTRCGESDGTAEDFGLAYDSAKSRYNDIQSERFAASADLSKALEASNYLNVTMSMAANVLDSERTNISVVYKFELNNYRLSVVVYASSDGASDGYAICFKSGNTWYQCTKTGTSEWTKEAVSFELADLNIVDAVLEDLLAVNKPYSFTWNTSKKLYEATNSSGYKIEIKFTNGAVSAIAIDIIEDGERAYVYCLFDDYGTTTVTIPDELLVHTHTLVYHEGKDPTCTEAGYEAYVTCSTCDYSTYEELLALGHNFVNGKCTRCGESDGSGEAGDDDTYTRDGNYIYFGSYPQTKVTDSSLISSLNSLAGTLPTSSNSYSWTSYNYYIEGSVQNYMWYIDETYNNAKYRGVYFTSYRPYFCTYSSSASYSCQDDNGYNLSAVYWFKYESVKWKILTEKNGKAFLMCDMAIDAQQYYHNYEETRIINGKTIYANNYAESEIRKWLNETFYNTAFNSLQKSLIQTTIVDNSARSTNPYNNATQWNSGVNNYACENTSDKVFLLSEYEVTNPAYGFNSSYSAYDTARQLKSSDYSKSQGCYRYNGGSYDGNCWWWLRSPFYVNDSFAWSVGRDGDSSYLGSVYSAGLGVVPALWIAL